MKKNPKIVWKIYSFIFSSIAISHLIAVTQPETAPYIFYHILMAWSVFFNVHYYLAVGKSVVTIISLYPLWAYSFNREVHKNLEFWQWMLVLRIFLEVAGSYYEFVFIKASYYMILAYGLSVTGAALLPIIPSYFAHYFFAFPKKSVDYSSTEENGKN